MSWAKRSAHIFTSTLRCGHSDSGDRTTLIIIWVRAGQQRASSSPVRACARPGCHWLKQAACQGRIPGRFRRPLSGTSDIHPPKDHAKSSGRGTPSLANSRGTPDMGAMDTWRHRGPQGVARSKGPNNVENTPIHKHERW